jgi:Protein of unknown function (DUF1572)
MANAFTTSYIEDATERLRYYKRRAELAMDQVPTAALFMVPDSRSNSIAILVKHLSGNMRSRWTDFLTTDGEKPSRNYSAEFNNPPQTRDEVMASWESGWECAFATLSTLTDTHLTWVVNIRAESHSVMQAINRQMTHISYHVGQIVYLAKHFAGENWRSLTSSHAGVPAHNIAPSADFTNGPIG